MNTESSSEQDWDAAIRAVTERLHELGWDGKKRTARELLGVNEHLTGALLGLQPPRGTPQPSTLAAASERLGWAWGGLAKVLAGDPSGAKVVRARAPEAFSQPDPALLFRIAQLESAVGSLQEALDRFEVLQLADLDETSEPCTDGGSALPHR